MMAANNNDATGIRAAIVHKLVRANADVSKKVMGKNCLYKAVVVEV